MVRWEVKQTTPFLRTREFLWQEGHTAFAEKVGQPKAWSIGDLVGGSNDFECLQCLFCCS